MILNANTANIKQLFRPLKVLGLSRNRPRAMLSVWKLFAPILREYCMFFLFENSLQNLQNILFSFSSNLSHLYLSFHASYYVHAFLVKACVSDAVSISLSSDDCFPPKKDYSEPCTCFCFDILWLMF